jgi:hypothetical protein
VPGRPKKSKQRRSSGKRRPAPAARRAPSDMASPGIFFGLPAGPSFENPTLAFPDVALDNPTRSTLPLLAYWSSPSERLTAIRKEFAPNDGLAEATACFEYPVQCVGLNAASFTDLMLLAPQVAVAIEARWMEPLGDTIDGWRAGRDTETSNAALNHWFEIISGVTGRSPKHEADDAPLIYEMVHRVASLCSTGKRNLHLIYELFGGWHAARYEEELTRLAHRIRTEGRIGVWIHSVEVTASPEHEKLKNGWFDLPSSARADALRHLMLEGKAFQFGRETWTGIV